jgi:hypothetical protein
MFEGSKNSNHSDSTDSESSNEDFIDIINSKNDSKNDKFNCEDIIDGSGSSLFELGEIVIEVGL